MRATSYLDTSFLLKAYLTEVDSELVNRFLRSGTVVLVSAFTDLEFYSAAYRKVGRIEAELAIQDYVADRQVGIYEELPFSEAVVVLAQSLAVRYSGPLRLRSLDLLHLAFAVHYNIPTVASFDKRLRNGAEILGLSVFPPRP